MVRKRYWSWRIHDLHFTGKSQIVITWSNLRFTIIENNCLLLCKSYVYDLLLSIWLGSQLVLCCLKWNQETIGIMKITRLKQCKTFKSKYRKNWSQENPLKMVKSPIIIKFYNQQNIKLSFTLTLVEVAIYISIRTKTTKNSNSYFFSRKELLIWLCLLLLLQPWLTKVLLICYLL